jgi:hypothetical protein
MKYSLIIIAIALLGFASTHAGARSVDQDEALTVANNWITLIISAKGSWGGAPAAEVAEIEPFMRSGRVLGYFCRVNPNGYIIVSLHSVLAPVKAYSSTGSLDPTSGEGLTDVLKTRMESVLQAFEESVIPREYSSYEDSQEVFEIDYEQTWENLLTGDASKLDKTFKSQMAAANYSGGDILLTSAWHQNEPYNQYCPPMVGSQACDHAVVGCIATAGAQIMHYWAWPPYGTGDYNDWYDWKRMPDTLHVDSPQTSINAVAELCLEVGLAAGTSYGCEASSAFLGGVAGPDMLDAFEDHFRYNSNADHEMRSSHTANGWFSIIVDNINANQPLQYGMLTSWTGGHSMVLDGWQIFGGERQYHMNYGWGEGSNTWYALDALDHSQSHLSEAMIRKLKPAPSLDSWLSGSYYSPSFPYRYFNRDATGHSAVFYGGQNLQFLPGITVKCTSPDGGSIQFVGTSTQKCRLFSRGDIYHGAKIQGGQINLYNEGAIKLY